MSATGSCLQASGPQCWIRYFCHVSPAASPRHYPICVNHSIVALIYLVQPSIAIFRTTQRCSSPLLLWTSFLPTIVRWNNLQGSNHTYRKSPEHDKLWPWPSPNPPQVLNWHQNMMIESRDLVSMYVAWNVGYHLMT